MDLAAPSSRLMTSIRSGFRKPTSTGVSSTFPSVTDSLKVLDSVLTEIEQNKITQVSSYDPSAQVIPTVVAQATNTLNVNYGGHSTAKETLASATPAVEAAAGIQYVEEEKNPEIPIEVESYLKKVEQTETQLPNEIVIADQTQIPLASHYAKQPVIVLPLTPEIEKMGAKKPTTVSIRWLVEWSRKLMKVFTGKVIYREL